MREQASNLANWTDSPGGCPGDDRTDRARLSDRRAAELFAAATNYAALLINDAITNHAE